MTSTQQLQAVFQELDYLDDGYQVRVWRHRPEGHVRGKRSKFFRHRFAPSVSRSSTLSSQTSSFLSLSFHHWRRWISTAPPRRWRCCSHYLEKGEKLLLCHGKNEKTSIKLFGDASLSHSNILRCRRNFVPKQQHGSNSARPWWNWKFLNLYVFRMVTSLMSASVASCSRPPSSSTS